MQIEDNYGGSAGILGMLLQSHGGEVHLLPALPRAWQTGSVQGVRARGGFVVDLTWERMRPASVTIRSTIGGPSRVRWGSPTLSFETAADGLLALPGERLASS